VTHGAQRNHLVVVKVLGLVDQDGEAEAFFPGGKG